MKLRGSLWEEAGIIWGRFGNRERTHIIAILRKTRLPCGVFWTTAKEIRALSSAVLNMSELGARPLIRGEL